MSSKQTKLLFRYIGFEQAELAIQAIQNGANPNGQEKDGFLHTPLTAAIQRGQGSPSMVALLLANGADPSLVNGHGWMPWVLNQEMKRFPGHFPIKRLLEEVGANRGDERLLALRDAAKIGDHAEVERLLASGADPDAAPFTPLAVAANEGFEEIVVILLNAGTDVNRKDCSRGDTPLMRAAMSGHLEVVKRLVEAGATMSAEKISDTIPSDLARMNGHQEVERWLNTNGSPTRRMVRAICLSNSLRQKLDWEFFERHITAGNGEHSLLFVNAPIEEVSSKFAEQIESAELFTGIQKAPQSISRTSTIIPVIELVGQSWTLVVHGIGSLGGNWIFEGQGIAAALTAMYGWKSIHAFGTDNGDEDSFKLFKKDTPPERHACELLTAEKILTPGINPHHEDGIEIIGVSPEMLHRVDIVTKES